MWCTELGSQFLTLVVFRGCVGLPRQGDIQEATHNASCQARPSSHVHEGLKQEDRFCLTFYLLAVLQRSRQWRATHAVPIQLFHGWHTSLQICLRPLDVPICLLRHLLSRAGKTGMLTSLACILEERRQVARRNSTKTWFTRCLSVHRHRLLIVTAYWRLTTRTASLFTDLSCSMI